MSKTIIEAKDLTRHYTVKKGFLQKKGIVKALESVCFKLQAGKTLAVVGESGCGKSTLARMVAMIEAPTRGSLEIDGQIASKPTSQGQRFLPAIENRKSVQIVFQNPYASLNPRHKTGTILEEPLLLNTKMQHAQRRKLAEKMMERVGLRPEHYDRYPHMFSGGQRQRIAIARAMILNPRVLVLDEPVSALDLSIQAQVLNILTDLQEERGLAYVFISHDLSVVKHLADDVMVMYLGKIVEAAPTKSLFEKPRHPYTAALLSATPTINPAARKKRITLTGELPSPLNPPKGCAFNPRCANASNICRTNAPPTEVAADRQLACFNPIV